MKFRLLVTALYTTMQGGVSLSMRVIEFDTKEERAAAAQALTLSNRSMSGGVQYDFVPL